MNDQIFLSLISFLIGNMNGLIIALIVWFYVYDSSNTGEKN